LREKTNRGARVPLFERLIDLEPAVSWEPQPLRTFDEAGLRASVRNAVSRILNSRSNLPDHLREYVRGTVLDFGIPDTTTYSPASETDRFALGDLIARSIALYEPRLRDVSIVIEPHATNPRALVAVLRASMLINSRETAVSFPLTIDSAGADATPEEPPERINVRAQSAGK
jgi:type VI secretion system protein ImpF